MQKLSYILELRNSLKAELRNMPLFQNGSAIIAVNDEDKILLMKRADRDQWCVPGGLQELGETFEEVAIRELKEETGLDARIEDLILIKAVSGESRKNSYSNGDVVYNNTILYAIKKYKGKLESDHAEIVFTGKEFILQKEVKGLAFFDLNHLPDNLMDKDLIEEYVKKLGEK